jgi:hypothetical protein
MFGNLLENKSANAEATEAVGQVGETPAPMRAAGCRQIPRVRRISSASALGSVPAEQRDAGAAAGRDE